MTTPTEKYRDEVIKTLEEAATAWRRDNPPYRAWDAWCEAMQIIRVLPIPAEPSEPKKCVHVPQSGSVGGIVRESEDLPYGNHDLIVRSDVIQALSERNKTIPDKWVRQGMMVAAQVVHAVQPPAQAVEEKEIQHSRKKAELENSMEHWRERTKTAEARNAEFVKEFDRLTTCIAAQSNHLGRIDTKAYLRGRDDGVRIGWEKREEGFEDDVLDKDNRVVGQVWVNRYDQVEEVLAELRKKD